MQLNELYQHFSLIPLNGKVPLWNDWTKYKTHKAPFESLQFHDGNFGVVCGYEGLEVIDIDNHFLNADALFAWIDDNFNLKDFLITRTQNKGYHLYYRVENPLGSKALAKRKFNGTSNKGILPDGKETILFESNGQWYANITMVETRGEGGQVVFYDNIIKGSITSIPKLTNEKRDELWTVCRALNEVAEKEAPKIKEKVKIEGKLPGDIYNEDPNAVDETFRLLIEAGWTTSDNIHWWRPGKTQNEGPSATFGKVAPNRFYNFSSNGFPFQERVSESLFGVRAILKHEGNFNKCAKELAKLYGIKGKDEKKKKKTKWQVLSDIIKEWKLQFRYNQLTTVVDVSVNGGQFNKFELLIGDIIKEMESNRGISAISKNKLHEMIENSDTCIIYNPIKDFFKSLPQWDGVDHFENLMQYISLYADEDAQFFKNMFRKHMIRAVKCALIPKYVNRMVFVLFGPQEVGKTMFFRWLMPIEDLYNDENIDPNEKDSILALSRYLMINMDELDGLNKREVSKLKSFISKGSINKRVSYGRNDENFIRIASLFGSTNKSDLLADSNNTRWIILKIMSFDWEGYVKNINPMQIWAQAYKLFSDNSNAGELTKKEKNTRDHRNESEFLEISSEREILMKYFEIGNLPLTATDIKGIIEKEKYPLKINIYQLTRELKRLFGDPSLPKRENNKLGRYYYLKTDLLQTSWSTKEEFETIKEDEVPF